MVTWRPLSPCPSPPHPAHLFQRVSHGALPIWEGEEELHHHGGGDHHALVSTSDLGPLPAVDGHSGLAGGDTAEELWETAVPWWGRGPSEPPSLMPSQRAGRELPGSRGWRRGSSGGSGSHPRRGSNSGNPKLLHLTKWPVAWKIKTLSQARRRTP